MKIALIGYGNMGREVELLAKERGIPVVAVFTSRNNRGGTGLSGHALADADVCIDFSSPAAVIGNIEAVARSGKNIIVGTTGWLDRLDHVQQLVSGADTGLLYASNFSLGMNLFFRLVGDAARIFDGHPGYDVGVHEVHHSGKSDSPSGTALSIASLILEGFKRKTGILHETAKGKIEPDKLHLTSSRIGQVQGRHTVTFDSVADTIELTHSAKNRRGFAEGALLAAEWLKGKKGVYTMNDLTFP